LIVFFAGGWVAWSMDSEAAQTVDPFRVLARGWAGLPMWGPGRVRALFYLVGLNPVGSWAFLSGIGSPADESAVDPELLRTQYAAVACGALIYASAAGLLWLDARRRLHAESSG
jgi:hypothetical protein